MGQKTEKKGGTKYELNGDEAARGYYGSKQNTRKEV